MAQAAQEALSAVEKVEAAARAQAQAVNQAAAQAEKVTTEANAAKAQV